MRLGLLAFLLVGAILLQWAISRSGANPVDGATLIVSASPSRSSGVLCRSTKQIDIAVDTARASVALRQVAGPQAESSDVVDGASGVGRSAVLAPALAHALRPAHSKRLDRLIGQLQSNDYPLSMRLDAAQFLLNSSISLNMELAGTALPAFLPGEDRRLPAPLRFVRNERQYCFEQGEYPAWDRLVALLEEQSAGIEIGISADLQAEIVALALDAKKCVDEFNR